MDWTKEEIEQTKAAYLSGLSLKQIAEQLGRSEKSIRNKLARSGISVDELKRRVPKLTYYDDCKVLCPFYLEFQNAKSVTCEGIISKTVIVNKFANPEDFSNYFAKYCCSDYQSCPVSEKLFAKYE